MDKISLMHTLTGHQNPIYTLACVDGFLYSAGADKGVVEWDLHTGKFVRILCNVPSSVYTLYAIPHTSYLAIGMRSGDIFIVDRKENKLVKKLSVDSGAVFAMASISAKGELIAIGEEGKAYVWSLTDFDLLYSFQISKTTVRVITVSDDGRLLAFGDKDGYIYLVDTMDYHIIVQQRIHEATVSSLLFMDKMLLSGGRDAQLYRLELENLNILERITPHMFTVYGIARLDDFHFSTVSRDKTLKIWNLDFKLQKNISRDKGDDAHHLSINSQTFASALGLLATAGDDKMIKIWKAEL